MHTTLTWRHFKYQLPPDVTICGEIFSCVLYSCTRSFLVLPIFEILHTICTYLFAKCTSLMELPSSKSQSQTYCCSLILSTRAAFAIWFSLCTAFSISVCFWGTVSATNHCRKMFMTNLCIVFNGFLVLLNICQKLFQYPNLTGFFFFLVLTFYKLYNNIHSNVTFINIYIITDQD